MKRPIQRLLPLLAFWPVITGGLSARAYDALYEQPPVNYSSTQPAGPVAKLQAAMDAGEVMLDRRDEQVFLRALLRELNIPVESQVLVFSKTSQQNSRISPATPRAIYFNDDVYVGWVQGGIVEIADPSPGLGVTFHTLDHRDLEKPLQFERPATCLDCHAGSRVNNLPGVMVRSVFPDERGQPILSQGSFVTGHASPMTERWGGWYVTGRHGDARHMGNATAREVAHGAELDVNPGANRTNLSPYFNTRPYLTDSSDIVALMVLEHQCEMQNLLVQAAIHTRVALHRQTMLRQELGEPPTDELVGSGLIVANSQAEKIVRHLLFTDEILLPDGGISGRPDFQTAFQRNARRDESGRSLKDFDLQNRLFRHRCSYMIYSSAFADLPVQLKEKVYARLLEVLDGNPGTGARTRLGIAERQAIKEILVATKKDFAEFVLRKE